MGTWVEVGPGRSVFRVAAGGSESWEIAEDALEPYVNQAGVAEARRIHERWQREVWPRIDAAGERARELAAGAPVVRPPVWRTAPSSVLVCGSELADGRLVLVAAESPGMVVSSVSGRQCEVHDADWPRGDGKPIGACLVTYELVKGARS